MSQFITCIPIGAQVGRQRHPNPQKAPRVKGWRCDLTGLSSRHNLYFVACNDSIHVYQPSFPDQSLTREPQLVLHPPVSSPNLNSHIDPEHPHSITRVLVDYLGNDEILLVTCDDGDVIGYRVDEVQRFLDKLESSSMSGEDFHDPREIRTFLHRNVGASAWGLAVHREARMIAISANTHQVTVLAFALARPGSDIPESTDFPDEISLTGDAESTDFPSPRSRDHVFTLLANHNVPAVSFNNTAGDLEGRWLFSSCINGETMLWDLHNPRSPERMYQMGWCSSADEPERAPEYPLGHCRCANASNYPHSAWGAMFLDPRSAHEIDEPKFEPTHRAPCFEDVGGQKSKFRVRNIGLTGLSVVSHDMMADEMSDGSPMVLSDSDSDDSDEPSSVDDHSASIDNEAHTATGEAESDNELDVTIDENGSQGTIPTPPTYTGPPLPSIQTLPDVTPNLPASLALPSLLSGPTSIQAMNEIAQILYANGSMDEDDDDDDDDDNEEEIAAAWLASNNVPYLFQDHPSRPYTRRRLNAYCEITTNHRSFQGETSPAPCLIITKDDIFLLQRPLHPSSSVSSVSSPITTLRRVLHPSPEEYSIPSYDRLCFSTSLPSLGIFIVASPVGRAAIFALTRSRATGAYGFELAYILPFSGGREDEVVGMVDGGVRLMGVAVGKVQGGEEGEGGGEEEGEEEGEGRARLLMYYTDHSVVGFEVGRKREWGEVVV